MNTSMSVYNARPRVSFLFEQLQGQHLALAWDLGANDGHFSKIAALHSDIVVAMDSDHLVMDNLYNTLVTVGQTNILPLIQDLANPSPGLGWRGLERTSIETRGNPDLVMCFAVVHHLVIGRNVPLRSVLDWLRDLDARVIFEFVPMGDPMVERLIANKRPREIHTDYNEDSLRSLMADRFEIEREIELPAGDRLLFSLRPRD